MIQKIKDSTSAQVYEYMMNNLKQILDKEVAFPTSLLMFLNNPRLKDLTKKQRNKYYKEILSELNEECLDIYIDVLNEEEEEW